jgi:hypothetical protein
MTRARSLMAGAVLLGAILRLPALGAAPFEAGEATHAWRAARAAAGDVVADGVTNPCLAPAQAALFALAGPGDVLSRLPAALCGLALLLVPLLLGEALGPVRATALAFLLAVDPTLVRAARDGSGSSAAVLAAALAVVGLVRWSLDGRRDAAAGRRAAVLASAAAGLLVTAGSEAWSLAPLLALVAIALRPWRACPARGTQIALAFFGTAAVAATAGLWAHAWASGVSASLTAWLTAPREAGALLGVLRARPLAILLSVVAIVRVTPGRAVAFAIALSWGVAMALRSHESALALVLAVAAAQGVAVLEGRGVRKAAWLAALTASGVAALAFQGAAAARPALNARVVASSRDLRTLAADVERLAIAKGREAHELPVLVLGEPPADALAWALRDGRNVRFQPLRPRISGGPGPVMISRSVEPAPPGYFGATYASPQGPVNLWVPIEP